MRHPCTVVRLPNKPHAGRGQLGWALDVVNPSGLRSQLHTRAVISADDE